MKLSEYPLVEGILVKRDNRFIARVEIEGKIIKAHVPNTGRMSELMVSGAKVLMAYQPSETRKTDYTLIVVNKDGVWVSIHSVKANDIAFDYLKKNNLFGKIKEIKKEVTYGNSRFDLAFTVGETKWYCEVKSANLVIDRQARFPDAPTLRGRKHLRELMVAKKNGYGAGVLFIIQRNDAETFAPNTETDREFSQLLLQCHHEGVRVKAVMCDVTTTDINPVCEVPVILDR
jgi:sugar fermentation stimulation protein A